MWAEIIELKVSDSNADLRLCHKVDPFKTAVEQVEPDKYSLLYQ